MRKRKPPRIAILTKSCDSRHIWQLRAMSGFRTSGLLQRGRGHLISQCNGNALLRASQTSKAQPSVSQLEWKGLALRQQFHFRDRNATEQTRAQEGSESQASQAMKICAASLSRVLMKSDVFYRPTWTCCAKIL